MITNKPPNTYLIFSHTIRIVRVMFWFKAVFLDLWATAQFEWATELRQNMLQ